MGHNHSHEGHSHAHQLSVTDVNNALVIGILLNFLFVVIEVIIGLHINSLSLLSDAGHNLADVGSLLLSLIAFKLLRVRSNKKYTYGYKKTTVLTSLFNSVVLLVSIGAIVYEAIHHFFHPQPLPGGTIAIVAAIGIIVNGLSAYLFLKNKEKDLNIKSAYLHLLSDALVSLGLVIGGLVIYYTHLYWIDPVLSIVIAVTILISTWNLLRDSFRLSMDGVPKDIDLDQIKKEAMIDGVKDIYHIHIWAMSTTENAMTAHIILQNGVDKEKECDIKAEIRHKMLHQNIQHVTLETEFEKSFDSVVNCN
jgi:cation diffusion facilitator family transporter